MALANATLFGQRWGPERWQIFSYYANPWRDTNGNPCFVYRHGGGGWSGMALGFGAGDILSTFVEYLLDPARAVHFDFISIQTCQQYIDETASYTPRTTRHNHFDNVVDHKRGVAAIKAWGTGALGQTTYKLDPGRIITAGHSFGANVTGLSMITPPLTFPTQWRMGARRIFEPQQFDSSPAGVLYFSGQVDYRKRLLSNGGAPALLDYLDWQALGGIFGTPDNAGAGDTSAQWDMVPTQAREAFSLLAYLERPESRQYYKPMFTLYQNAAAFAGTYPLANNHDKRMRTDLNAALEAAGLPYSTDLTPDGSEPGPTSAANNANIYNWAARLVS